MTVNLSPTGVSEFPNISTSVGGGWSCHCGGLAPAVNMLDESLIEAADHEFGDFN